MGVSCCAVSHGRASRKSKWLVRVVASGVSVACQPCVNGGTLTERCGW
jgi:hypothetical protein